jgi:hypothetical protein
MLVLAAVSEAATGVALLIVPSLVGRLLLGEELTGIAIPVARVAGIALIALGVACWPGTPLVGMLTYSAAVMLYLAYVGFAGGLIGILLWPAVVLRMILTALLTRASTRDQETNTERHRPCPPGLIRHGSHVRPSRGAGELTYPRRSQLCRPVTRFSG